MARTAHLPRGEAEVFALLVAVELPPARQRPVADIQDSAHLPRFTLATLARVFAERDHAANARSPQLAAAPHGARRS